MDIRMNRTGVVMVDGKLQLTSGRGEALAQRLTIRLCTHLRSWYLNTLLGIDYMEKVFEKTVQKESLDLLFQTEIVRDPRVEKVIEFKSKRLRNSYELTFKVKARDGTVSDTVEINVTPSGININF